MMGKVENRETIPTALGLGAGEITRVTGPRGGLRHYEGKDLNCGFSPAHADCVHSAKRIARLPSVTTIISETVRKPGLERWREGMIRKGFEPNRKAQQAAAMGTALHAIIERLLSGDEDVKVPDELEPAVAAFGLWRASYPGLRHVESEVAVYNMEMGYAGTIDAIFEEHSDALTLVDFKSGSRVYPEACMQLSMYIAGLHSMGYQGNIEGTIVLFQKVEGVFTGRVEVADIDKSAWSDVWRGVLNLYEVMDDPIETTYIVSTARRI